ncbi:hypothetical protein HZA57_00730, partial [Candidatus Poribacteria bacterium]|nr:hypothetical protein [Candidatus Poribacteria bacterium]
MMETPNVRRVRLVLIALVLALGTARAETTTSPTLTLASFLDDMGETSHLARGFDPPARLLRFSSADPTGGDHHRGQYLRREGQEFVLFDAEGPGVLVRLWSETPQGGLRFYADGAAEPQFIAPWADLIWDPKDPLNEPFLDGRNGGGALHFPVPFAKSLKITVSQQVHFAWQADYYALPPEWAVTTWLPGMPPAPEVPPA